MPVSWSSGSILRVGKRVAMRGFVTIVAFAVATLVACCGEGCHSADAQLQPYEFAADIRRDAKVVLTTRPADVEFFTADAAGGK